MFGIVWLIGSCVIYHPIKKESKMKSETVSDFIYDFANGEMYYIDIDTKEVLLDLLGANENEEISLPFKNEEDLKTFLQTFAAKIHNISIIQKVQDYLRTIVKEEMQRAMNQWLNKPETTDNFTPKNEEKPMEENTRVPKTNVSVKLIGEDGNAFVILGRVSEELRSAGYNDEFIKDFVKKATSSNYLHLLATVSEYVHVK